MAGERKGISGAQCRRSSLPIVESFAAVAASSGTPAEGSVGPCRSAGLRFG